VFQTLRHLIAARKSLPAFADGDTRFFDTGNPHVLGYARNGQVWVLANFAETSQDVPLSALDPAWPGGAQAADLACDREVAVDATVHLEPYQFVWLRPLE